MDEEVWLTKITAEHWHGTSQVMDGWDGIQIWRVAVSILNKQSWTDDKGAPPAWRVGEGLTTPHHKNPACYEMLQRAAELADSCEYGNELLGSIKGREFLD
jgi:hypothetical protein